MSEIQANKLSPASGTALQVGDSGDTITIPSGATITNSGTSSGFGMSNLAPYFHVYLNSSQTTADTALTKVLLDTEVFDSGNYFASNKWTPTAGTYFVYAQARFQINGATTNLGATIKKNGSDLFEAHNYGYYYTSINVFGTVSMNGSDYLELFAVQNSTQTQNISTGSDNTFMGGYKIA
jgi:hypothetical protein